MPITRRHFLATAAAVPLAGKVAWAQGAELVYAGSGGGLAQVMASVFDEPFAQATGVTVRALATTERASALRAMMAAGSPIWDVAELTPVDYATASAEGWLEPIDWARIDPDNALPAIAKLPDAGVAATYSTLLAVRTDQLPQGRSMESWADFWDVAAFPGPRALQNSPMENLEFALLADGVALADLYAVLATPEGVDRAFAKLDAIKPHVAAWWTAGAQPVQMLTDGEVAFTSAWNGRISQMQDAGQPVAAIWNGAGLKASYVGIIRGTRMREAAHDYIAFMLMDPERSAQFAAMVSYPGMLPALYDHLSPEAGQRLPTHPDNLALQFATDARYWYENMSALRERWDEWLLA